MKPALLILIGYGLATFFVVQFGLYRSGPLIAVILVGVGLALAWAAGGMFYKAGRVNFWAALAAVLLLVLAILFTSPTVKFASLSKWLFGLLVTAPITLINLLAVFRCLWLRHRNG